MKIETASELVSMNMQATSTASYWADQLYDVTLSATVEVATRSVAGSFVPSCIVAIQASAHSSESRS